MHRSFVAALILAAGAVGAGCSSTLVNQRIERASDLLASSEGIPWVETRQYDVYVFEGGKQPTGSCPSANREAASRTVPAKQIYYGRHELLDEVSGVEIDAQRRRWQTNYKAALFSDGTLLLEFDELGVLKKAEVSGSPGGVEAAKAAGVAAGVPGEIEKGELARRKQELERLDTERKIREAQTALEGSD